MGFGRIGSSSLAGMMAALMLVPAGAAQASEARFDIRYNVRLSVLPVSFATGTFKAVLPREGRYMLDLGARGIGFGVSGKTVGTVSGGALRPYSVAIDTEDADDDKRSIRMSMLGGTVRSETITPPVPYREDRVPITREHRTGVVDPLSAMIVPVADPKKPGAEACNRRLPIFEGTERFDIVLSYLRTEKVTTQKGYSGPAVVCRVRYKAISGHRERRRHVKYMEDNRTIEVWLAPIEEARVLVPWRVSLSTMIGTLVVEAQEFNVRGGGAVEAGAASRSGTAN